MNVKANKRLMELAEVDSLAIFPSCGDETLPFGVAYLAQAARGQAESKSIPPLDAVYLGPDVSEQSCLEAIDQCGHIVRRYDDVEAEVAQVLAAGKPVVATPLPEAVNLGEYVMLAPPERFAHEVERALVNPPPRSLSLWPFLNGESWDTKAALFLDEILRGL